MGREDVMDPVAITGKTLHGVELVTSELMDLLAGRNVPDALLDCGVQCFESGGWVLGSRA